MMPPRRGPLEELLERCRELSIVEVPALGWLLSHTISNSPKGSFKTQLTYKLQKALNAKMLGVQIVNIQ